MKSIVLWLVSVLWLGSCIAEDSFRWDGKINGTPVRLLLDTGYGAGEVFVFRSLADRLALNPLGPKVRDADGIVAWPTEAVVELPGWSGHKATRIAGQIGVYDPPDSLLSTTKVEGGIGWPLIRKRITQFDARAGKFHFLSIVPKETATWIKFQLLTDQTLGRSPCLTKP